MSIWFAPFTVEDLNRRFRVSMAEHLSIEFTEFGADWMSGTMPVDHRTMQPMGLLHGGASVALAETLGSVAGNLCLDFSRLHCVGQDINANHLRAVRSGMVTGTARPFHLGARSQVWQIEIRDPAGELACVSRLTLAVIPAR
jgi:1,4-dihydroxy-2-naphthoyl-CoA hydrolase